MRDYKKEAQRRKEKYKELRCYVPHGTYNKFLEKIKSKNMTVSFWVKEKIKEELDN